MFERFTRADASRVRTPGAARAAAPASGWPSSRRWSRPIRARSRCRASRARPEFTVTVCRWPTGRPSHSGSGPNDRRSSRPDRGRSLGLADLLRCRWANWVRYSSAYRPPAASRSIVPAALDDPAVLDDQDQVGRHARWRAGGRSRPPSGRPAPRPAPPAPPARRWSRDGRSPRPGSPPAGGPAAAGRWSAAAARRRTAGSRAPPPPCPARRAARRPASSSRARRSASHSSSSAGALLASSRFSRTDSWNRWPSWVTMPRVCRSEAKLRSRTSTPPMDTVPASTS